MEGSKSSLNNSVTPASEVYKPVNGEAENLRLKLAVIGLGGFGQFIAQRIVECPNVALVGGYDPDSQARGKFAQQFSCQTFLSLEDTVNNRQVEALFLASPNHTHREQTELAAKNKKHVFVTKPMANAVCDGLAMINICQENGVLLFLDHPPSRWSGWQAKMKEMIDSGIIGNIVHVEANGSSPSGLFLKPENWRWRHEWCPGGALIQLGIYQANTLCYLIGCPKRVHSFFNRLYVQADIPDVTTTVIEFKNGVLGYLGSSYAAGSDPFWIQVHGTEGSLVRDDREGLFIRRGRYGRLEKVDFGAEETPETHYVNVLSEFAQVVKQGKKPYTDARELLYGLAIVEAAVKSAEEKRDVEIREVLPDISITLQV